VSDAFDTVFRHADWGVLLYALTPPRLSTPPERAEEIARVTLSRLAPLDLDALVVYDVDAESDRSAGERPFPFAPMMDPGDFLDGHLAGWRRPAVVYRAVGKYSPRELAERLGGTDPDRRLAVLVGAASRDQAVRTRLADAYRLHAEVSPQLPMGGVVIAERHAAREDEHHRMLRKHEAGCRFFVSQICYDLDHTRNLLSDYAYGCRDRGEAPRPVVVTLAPCGSVRTLEFMTWLGIDIPRWLRNELTYADDPLTESYEHCLAAARDLITFCRRLGLPFGISVESVTNRKVEIEASVDLARTVQGLLRRP
jgi:Methylenetetrahydrofolate reductase